MNSYYTEIAELIEQDYKSKVRPITCGEFKVYEPSTLMSKVRKFFSKFHKEKEEIVPADLDTKKSLISTITSYSGADLVVTVGTEVIGELTNIRWYAPHKDFIEQLEHSDYYDKELAMKKPVVVLAEWTMFNKDVFDEGLDNADIVLTYANEYGQSSYRAIYGVSSLYNMSGTSIDEIVVSGKMILAAEKVTELKPGVACEK